MLFRSGWQCAIAKGGGGGGDFKQGGDTSLVGESGKTDTVRKLSSARLNEIRAVQRHTSSEKVHVKHLVVRVLLILQVEYTRCAVVRYQAHLISSRYIIHFVSFSERTVIDIEAEKTRRPFPVATAFVQKATEGTSLLRVELELEGRRGDRND